MYRLIPRLVPLLLAASAVALAAEKAENPVYKNWSGFRKGTSAAYRSVSEIGKTRYESALTYTLVDLTPEKAVVEIQVTVNLDGKQTRNRPQRFENPRALTLPPGVKPDQSGNVDGLIGEGRETVKVAGRDYDARWFKARSKIEAGETFTHSWSSDEVPGGLLKSVNTTPANKSSMTMELVEVKIP